MAETRGRPPKIPKVKYKCLDCKKEYVEGRFYSSESRFYSAIGRIPYCKDCIKKIYEYYYLKYKEENCAFPEKKAIKRLCMFLDMYYGDDAFNLALEQAEKNPSMTVFSAYMKVANLGQYSKYSYDDTFNKDEQDGLRESYVDLTNEMNIDSKVVQRFGNGFSEDDYKFLDKEYNDWTARHECETKSQEEIFKQICFTQLDLLKAQRAGADTKNLMATFQNLLDTAKLQPKQNKGDTMSDAQTFGTLIDKWESTRPIPEIDEELKDVDRIGLYLDVFFKGHLSKMMGLKNGLSNLYTKFMKKYTVEKPEYNDDENSEVLFDAIFGNQSLDSDDER
jgi:hypothetical protein